MSTENVRKNNDLSCDQLPLGNIARKTRDDEERSTISETLTINREDQVDISLEQELLNQTHVSLFPNDTTTMHQYRYTHESPIDLKSYITDATNTYKNASSETKSFFNHDRSPLKYSARSWADAPVFVPKKSKSPPNESFSRNSSPQKAKTWAQFVNNSFSSIVDKSSPTTYNEIGNVIIPQSIADAESQLCPFSLVGECRYGEYCTYVHGLICELCDTPSLHPNHEEQRKRHQKECLNQHEADMQLAFAYAQSKDKICGICMEVVMEKSKGEARFGILPNCNHCYCLSCIRQWRQATQFEKKIIRACPECRQTSDYVCPSVYWVETKEEKHKLFSSYKQELKKKECKYYKKGDGECPFGNACFYRHGDKNGKSVDVGPPSDQTINRPRLIRGAPSVDDPADVDSITNLVQRVLLLHFLEERDGRESIESQEYLDILDLFADVDESTD